MKYSIYVRCACTGPDGKPLRQACPRLWRADGAWNSRHGSAGWAARVPTSSGRKLVQRAGYESKAAAAKAAAAAGQLLELAGADDATRAQIGDMIARARRGQPLPAAEDVRRRLGLGLDPASPGVTFGEAWHAWLAGKKRLRQSARERLDHIGRSWLLPVLAEVPLERLNGAHCAAVFSRIEAINAEITARQGEGRAYVRVEGDVRTRPRVVGVASQHRVYAALREFCNHELRRTRRLAFNPVYAVELEPEVTPEAKRWSAAQARTFLAASADDPLHLAYRLILLRGLRRGELCGLRWADVGLDAGLITVRQTLLLIGAEVAEGRPKSRAGERIVFLDAGSVRLLREHRKAQLAEQRKARLAAPPGTWQDYDLVFCRDDGSPWKPDAVTRRFQSLARAAGLPVIKLHEGRHSAASLAHDAAVDPEIRRRTLGHADAAMTSRYTHPEELAYRAAAEAVAQLVDGAGS